MPRTCWVLGCKTRHKKGMGMKFHLFPKNEIIRNKWIEALKANNDIRNPTRHSNICNKHFHPEDYFTNPWRNKVLKKDAVPSIFPSPICKKRNTTKIYRKHEAIDSKDNSDFNKKLEFNILESKTSLTAINKAVQEPFISNTEYSTKYDATNKENELVTSKHNQTDNSDITSKTVCNKEQIIPNSYNEISKRQNNNAVKKSSVSVENRFTTRLKDENLYWLEIPFNKKPDVKRLGYNFETLVEEVKHMKLPSSNWKIVIIVQNEKYVSVNFLKKPFPEKVITIYAKNSACDIIVDHRNIALLGSPTLINSIADLEILLDIVDELNLNNPIISFSV